MPEYLAPGVYIEEIEIGAKPIEGVSTSTAGFLGLTERGPTDPRLITGFEQFQRLYGGFIQDSYLAYAVDGFFRNGGQRCFIGRIVKSDATRAHVTVDPITFEAPGEGGWGNRVAVRIENASLDRADLFKLTVAYWKNNLPGDLSAPADPKETPKKVRTLLADAQVVEVYDNLSTVPTSSDYYLSKLGKPKGVSNLVQLTSSGEERPANNTDPLFTVLADGDDGTDLTRSEFLGDPAAAPGERIGLTAFTELDEISIVYCPDLHSLDESNRNQLIDDIVSHCENLKDRFAILDALANTADIPGLRPPKDSKYAAFYYPWIEVFDPLTKGAKKVPPGGFVAGIYARSDQERGVHKAPANEVVRGASDVEFKLTKGEQDILNPRGVNCIRAFPGRGIRVWGARTTSSDTLWKYINVRRLFLYLEESIEEGTQWVVFEPNDEKLWARVKQTITQFLTRVWKDGALMGTTPEEAFFVKCDRTTMTQDDIDNGRLIVVIGVAPVKPAEFVIFRIAQWAGGSAVTE
ncbi:MAG: phage tail sheath family protein [Methanophagales archaeon ANME-1-THS]|nr:MAG: phage tail sheath family protein [Methanophagales archaeon ANME-1-THS]